MGEKPAKHFRDLILWQKAHHLVLSVYSISQHFPKYELFGSTWQLRRAAVSIAANIVEGFKKRTNPEKIRFFNIAQGSLEECRYYLILVEDLGYQSTTQVMSQLEVVSKILETCLSRIRQDLN
jgi:four helix bundle protein